MVVFVNLATFYLVGISIAVFLEFRMKLYAKVMKILTCLKLNNISYNYERVNVTNMMCFWCRGCGLG